MERQWLLPSYTTVCHQPPVSQLNPDNVCSPFECYLSTNRVWEFLILSTYRPFHCPVFHHPSIIWVGGQLSRYSDWLRAGRYGDRIPVGARFFVLVQTGPGAHPVSCTMSTGSFPGVKRPGRDADHPPPPSAEGENE
jgi:hypothetical protein